MNVRLLEIDSGGRVLAVGADSSPFTVHLLIAVDGDAEWYDVEARPNVLPAFDASLLVPSSQLEDRFRHEQYALHRICRLVGHELRGRTVKLPQQIAA